MLVASEYMSDALGAFSFKQLLHFHTYSGSSYLCFRLLALTPILQNQLQNSNVSRWLMMLFTCVRYRLRQFRRRYRPCPIIIVVLP